MNLLQKYAASRTTSITKEVVHAKLISFNPTKPTMVNGEAKDMIIATIASDAGQHDFWLFKDSVYGLPNYIPQGGLPCQLILREVADPKDASKTHVNAVSLGVGA